MRAKAYDLEKIFRHSYSSSLLNSPKAKDFSGARLNPKAPPKGSSDAKRSARGTRLPAACFDSLAYERGDRGRRLRKLLRDFAALSSLHDVS